MNFSELRKTIILELKKTDIKSAEIDAQILLEYVSGKSREFLLAHPEFELSADKIKKLDNVIDHRKKHQPIAYITGHKEFFGLDFLITPDVLIPRPETELIVEKALEFIGVKRNLKILDIGTGSGNIIISLTQNTSGDFSASDNSAAALKVAKQNATKHNAEIDFIKSDLFENISGNFDLIVANLPYVPIDGSDDEEIKHEPQSAIFSKDDGTEIIKKFLDQIQDHINKEGLILVEVDPRNAVELKKYAIKLYKSVVLKMDLSGIYRVITILT